MAGDRLLDAREKGLIVTNQDTVAIAIAAGVFLNPDPKRISITFQNIGANPVYLGLTSKVAVGQGLLLTTGNTVFTFNDWDQPGLPSRRFYAIASGGASSLYVLTSSLLLPPNG